MKSHIVLSMGGTMNVKLLLAASAAAVLGAGWFAGAGATADLTSRSGASASQAAAAAHQPELDLWSADPRLGVKTDTGVAISIPAGAPELGKMTLYVPAGYGLNIVATGRREGHVFLDTQDDFAYGDLKAVDPAAYANDPEAQACAPGQHAAVWTMEFEFFLSQDTVTVPIFIDPTSGDEAALGAYKFQACMPLSGLASPGGAPLDSRVVHLGLEFARSMVNPTSGADYVWRAFVSNPDVSGNPDPTTTYELRADMPLPSKLTLAGKYDGTHHRAVLTGRLTTKVFAVSRIPVTLYRRAKSGLWKAVATTRTSAKGSYRFAPSNRKTSVYSTEIWAIGKCGSASTAPGGCASETRGSIDSPNVRIAVRRHH